MQTPFLVLFYQNISPDTTPNHSVDLLGDTIDTDTHRLELVFGRRPLGKGVLLLGSRECTGGVKDDKDTHSQHHQESIESDEVLLVHHEVALPALGKLNGSEDVSDVNSNERHEHRDEDKTVWTGELVAERDSPADKVDGEDSKGCHGDELERDAADHNLGSWPGILKVAGRHRGHGAADCLDDERDEVTGQEHDGVHAR
jgi:hypothetical protein